MAIDVYPVKSSVSGDGKFQPTKGSASAGDINFAELMRSSGPRVGNGLMAMSDQAGITSIADKANAAAKFDDRPQEPVDDYSDSYYQSERRTDEAPRQDDQSSAGHRDDRPRDQLATRDNEQPTPVGENSAYESSAKAEDQPADKTEHASETENTNQQSASDDNGVGDGNEEGGETSGQASASGENSTEQTGNGSDNTVAGQAKAVGSNAEQILHSLLASAKSGIQTGNTADNGAEAGQNNGLSDKAVSGLNNALSNVTKEVKDPTAAQNTPTGEAAASSKTGAAVSAKDGFNLHASQATQAKSGNASQVANTAGATETQTAAASTTGSETAARQAAQLSRMVGDGPKISVSVETSGENTAVVSKPSASLTSNAVLIGENNAQNGRGHQAQNVQGANTGSAQANAAQVQANSGQAQANAAQTAAQANASTGGDAKGPIQGVQHAGATGSIAAGAGEGAATTGNLNATQQAQNSANAQAASTPRFAVPGQAVTEQVTVQITKALNAGTDKISINLKPADLGRVDVKMEISQDGRVTAVVTADNKNTLDLLQRDSKELQQALQDAGLQMDNDSLSFNLRERGEQGEKTQTAGPGLDDDGTDPGSNDDLDDGPPASQVRNIITDTRVDIQA